MLEQINCVCVCVRTHTDEAYTEYSCASAFSIILKSKLVIAVFRFSMERLIDAIQSSNKSVKIENWWKTEMSKCDGENLN